MKRLSIAGVDFVFERADGRGLALLHDYAAEFVVDDGESAQGAARSTPEHLTNGAVELQVSLETTDAPIRPEIAGGEARITRRDADVLIERFDMRGSWEPDHGRVEVKCWGERTSIGSLLRVLCGLALPRRGGLLVHASSVVSRGRAFLFPGASGAGKTTLATLAGARAVLCDEISAVRPLEGRFIAMPTPFFGEMSRRPRSEPATLCLIGRPTKNANAGDPARLVGIGPSVALAEILHCAVAFDESVAGRREVVDAATALVSRVPAFDVHFSLEHHPWNLLDELDLPASQRGHRLAPDG